jgi:hypothetical protein
VAGSFTGIVLHNFLHRSNSLISQSLVLENCGLLDSWLVRASVAGERTECQFFQSPTKGLGEHKIDKADFISKPATVRNKILPAHTVETDWVNEGGEEAGETAKQLEDSDTARPFGIWPYFHHVGWSLSVRERGTRSSYKARLTVSQRVVTHVVARRVGVDEKQHGNVGGVVWGARGFGGLGTLHGNSPGDIAKQQAASADEVHDAATNLDDEYRHDDTAEHAPAGNRNVDLLDVFRVLKANHLEKITEIVAFKQLIVSRHQA